MLPDEKEEDIAKDIGFTADELSSMVEGLLSDVDEMDIGIDEGSIGVAQDALPDLKEGALLVAKGDIWTLGNHKLVCGDCTEVSDLVKILDSVYPDVLWADPPDEDVEDVETGTIGVRIAAEYLNKGASVFIKYDSTSLDEISEMWVPPLKLCSELVWLSDTPTKDEKYFRRNHESIWYGWKFGGLRKWITRGTVPTVYNYPKPTVKEALKGIVPVSLIGDILKNVVEEGDIVYNPFSGFGSVLIACQQLGAHCYCIEKSPKKCDFIIRRWQQFTGDKAYQEN